jgi:hypothetical protein
MDHIETYMNQNYICQANFSEDLLIIPTLIKTYATSWKAADSIPSEVTEFSIDLNLPAALWLWSQLNL